MTCANRSLWVLTATAVLAVGSLAQALAAPASAGADVLVAVSGVVLAVCTMLLVRVLRYLTRATPAPTTMPRRRPHRRTRW